MRNWSACYERAVWNDNRLILNELHGLGLFDGYLTICRLKRTQDEY